MTSNRQHPVTDQVREWILGQEAGTVLTPTAVVQEMAVQKLKTNSGTASMVLRSLLEENRVVRTTANAMGSPRGGYRILPPAPPFSARFPRGPYEPP